MALDQDRERRYPFGRPITPRPPLRGLTKGLFVLGAYPSALHVAWTPPQGSGRKIKALAVDDEPTPFWDGLDEAERIAAWKEAVSFDSKRWGEIGPCGGLNGSTA